MKKPMIRIYIVLLASVAACVFIAPSALGHTSAWATDTTARMRLMKPENAQAADDDTGAARISFILDDGWSTQYSQGYAELQKYDYPASIAVIPAAVNTENYMSYSELADLYLDGWDMLNHTYNHVLLSGSEPNEQLLQMTKAREWLQSRGLKRGCDIVVYPGGEFDDNTVNALEAGGFSAGRSLKSLWSAQAGCSLENVEICNLMCDMSFENVEEAVNKAIRSGSALILIVHKIEPVTDDAHMQVPSEYFSRVVEYVHKNENSLRVMTLTQLLESY